MDYHTTLTNQQPWEQDPYYFKKVSISPLAMTKMAAHAESGGTIEVMGMLMGYCRDNEFVVKDVFRLPVEGTETRVNAGNDAIEYMVRYCDGIEDQLMIGWYHSHPGYDCWLSGIDVETQRLNQDFHKTWVALVVDPLKTKAQQHMSIGAFRTLPNNHQGHQSMQLSVRNDKSKDFGTHAHRYYALEVQVLADGIDQSVFDTIRLSNWRNVLQVEHDEKYFQDNLLDIKEKLGEKKKSQLKRIVQQTDKLSHEIILSIMTQLAKRDLCGNTH